MSSRGRGYGSRGSYGGRGGGGFRGSYRGSSRGSYESRGGRGGGSYSYSESRYSGGGGRYNRDRDEDTFKKPYRNESSYSNRDYGRNNSPDRKRMRMEASSDRRSHDGSGSYYSSRQESYGSERRGFASEDRRRSPRPEPRDSYRKSNEVTRSSAPRSRVSRPPRRSFRGRLIRSRGSFRGSLRPRGSFAPKRYSERSLAYTRALRAMKTHSSSKVNEEEASSTEEEWDAEDKDEPDEEKKESKTKTPKKEVSDDNDEPAAGEDTDKEGAEGSAHEEEDAAADTAELDVNLTCVHCKEKYTSFATYTKHLLSLKHRSAMSVVARRHKAQLLRMRVAQREAQRQMESARGAELASRSAFCLVCRLNHRTTRHAHNLTDTHRAMKRFLMPFCRVCRLTFRSPMIYEHHISSIAHLRKKMNQGARHASPKEEASADEGMDVDLDNFMTLDSVGDVDEVDDEDSGTEKKEEGTSKKAKVEINIGSEHIKKIEVLYCELCRVNLRSGSDPAEALRRHCRLRLHLGRYVQHRDTRTLRKHAERIHRQLHQNKESEKKVQAEDKKENDVSESVNTTTTEVPKKLENGNSVSGSEDKLWADVDKDIGELLREVDPQANDGSDDEDDLDRYDKFRNSGKKASKDVELETKTTENAEISNNNLETST